MTKKSILPTPLKIVESPLSFFLWCLGLFVVSVGLMDDIFQKILIMDSNKQLILNLDATTNPHINFLFYIESAGLFFLMILMLRLSFNLHHAFWREKSLKFIIFSFILFYFVPIGFSYIPIPYFFYCSFAFTLYLFIIYILILVQHSKQKNKIKNEENITENKEVTSDV